MNFTRGTFRVHGDVVEVYPAGSTDVAIRIEFFGDEIDRISEIDVLTGEVLVQETIFQYSQHLIMLLILTTYAEL